MQRKPITPGERYGRLTTVSIDPATLAARRRRWLCRCDCGQMASVIGYLLKSGNTSSCGCLRLERVHIAKSTHGLTFKVPEYGIWAGMIQRCSNPNVERYPQYGGRGISVCERWKKFEHFYADMGSRPTSQHQIDRIDNDGPYSPDNCRWASRSEQARNQSRKRLLTFNGKTLSMIEWSERLCVPYPLLRSRIHRGWTVERALTEPVHSGKS